MMRKCPRMPDRGLLGSQRGGKVSRASKCLRRVFWQKRENFNFNLASASEMFYFSSRWNGCCLVKRFVAFLCAILGYQKLWEPLNVIPKPKKNYSRLCHVNFWQEKVHTFSRSQGHWPTLCITSRHSASADLNLELRIRKTTPLFIVVCGCISRLDAFISRCQEIYSI